jgi:hypothetical protein
MTTQEKVLGAEFHNRTRQKLRVKNSLMIPLDKLGVLNFPIAPINSCE